MPQYGCESTAGDSHEMQSWSAVEQVWHALCMLGGWLFAVRSVICWLQTFVQHMLDVMAVFSCQR
jgi:hypothetical protein